MEYLSGQQHPSLLCIEFSMKKNISIRTVNLYVTDVEHGYSIYCHNNLRILISIKHFPRNDDWMAQERDLLIYFKFSNFLHLIRLFFFSLKDSWSRTVLEIQENISGFLRNLPVTHLPHSTDLKKNSTSINIPTWDYGGTLIFTCQ